MDFNFILLGVLDIRRLLFLLLWGLSHRLGSFSLLGSLLLIKPEGMEAGKLRLVEQLFFRIYLLDKLIFLLQNRMLLGELLYTYIFSLLRILEVNLSSNLLLLKVLRSEY